MMTFADASDMKINDFDPLSDTVIATLAQKKSVRLYDTMLPYNYAKQAMIQEFKLSSSHKSANLVLCNQRT